MPKILNKASKTPGFVDAATARIQRRVRARPGLATTLGDVARRSRGTLAAAGVLWAAGVALQRPWLAGAGLVALALAFGLPAWRQRHARRSERFQHAMAHGDWPAARTLFERIRRGRHPPIVAAQLPIDDALLRVREGESLALVLARVAPLRSGFPAGQFDARLAAIHAAAHDYDGVLACMRAAWEAAPDDPSRRVDYALANARVGDLALARDLLERVDMEALERGSRPFAWWARGLVELRNDRAGALDSLRQGVAGLLDIPAVPALASLALCSGACAIAMRRAGDVAGAKALVAAAWPVLSVHADPRLRAEIEREVGTP